MYKRVNRYDSILPFSSMLFSHNIALLLRYYMVYLDKFIKESCKQKSIAEVKKVPQNLHS